MAIRNLSDGTIDGFTAFDERKEVPITYSGVFNITTTAILSRVGNIGFITVKPISGIITNSSHQDLLCSINFPAGFLPITGFRVASVPITIDKVASNKGVIQISVLSMGATINIFPIEGSNGNQVDILGMTIPYICA